jgi:hypothetical protein
MRRSRLMVVGGILSRHSSQTTPTYWLDDTYDSRLVVEATNDSAYTLHDHLLDIAIPAGVTVDTDSLVVVELTTLDTVDHAFGWRYATGISVNRLRFLPASVSGSTVRVKTLGRWLASETRSFALYWDSTGVLAQSLPTYIAAAVSGSYSKFERLGPDTSGGNYVIPATARNLGIATTNTGLQARLASRLGISPTGEDSCLRWLEYRANGDATSYGLVTGDYIVTDDGPTCTLTGTVTGATRSGSPDWAGTIQATYEHKLVTGRHADGTGEDTKIKQADVLHVVLTLVCQQAYTPNNDATAGTGYTFNSPLRLYHAASFSGNVTTEASEQLVNWYATASAGPTAISADGDTASLAIPGTIIGGAGNAMCMAVRINSATLSNFGPNQPNAFLKWLGSTLQIGSLTNTATIPVGATITLDFTVAHHNTNSATTEGNNMTPSEMVALLRGIETAPSITVGDVERYSTRELARTLRLASDDAVDGHQWFVDNAATKGGGAHNHAYQHNLQTGLSAICDDDDSAYGHAHLLHGLCLRYLRTHDTALIATIEAAVQWQIDIEQAAVAAYGDWWEGSAPYWYAPAAVTKPTEGGVSNGDVDPNMPGGVFGSIDYSAGDVRRLTSVDQLHMKAHGLYAYLYLLRNESAITTNTTLQTDARALVARMATFEAAHIPSSSRICANLNAIVNGNAPARANGITATELNDETGSLIASFSTDWEAWQVNDSASTLISPSSNLTIDDFFRALFAAGSDLGGVTTYLQKQVRAMLASDLSRHDVTGTAAWTEYDGAGVVTQPYPPGWMARAGATGNNYLFSSGRAGDDHYINLTGGGARDHLSGRGAQRLVVLCLAALLDPDYDVPVELTGGSAVVRSVTLREAIDDTARALALYGTEATTKARKFSDIGLMGAASPKTVDSAFTGYWMMAVELWHLVNTGASYADYYPIGQW